MNRETMNVGNTPRHLSPITEESAASTRRSSKGRSYDERLVPHYSSSFRPSQPYYYPHLEADYPPRDYAEHPGYISHSMQHQMEHLHHQQRPHPYPYEQGLLRSDSRGYSPGLLRSDSHGYKQGLLRSDSHGYTPGLLRSDSHGYKQGLLRSDSHGYKQGLLRSDSHGYKQGLLRSDSQGYKQGLLRSDSHGYPHPRSPQELAPHHTWTTTPDHHYGDRPVTEIHVVEEEDPYQPYRYQELQRYQSQPQRRYMEESAEVTSSRQVLYMNEPPMMGPPPQRQTSWVEQVPIPQKSLPTIEVSPGVHLRLRGAAETKLAILEGRYIPIECPCCISTICCIDEADYVVCCDCRVVSATHMGEKTETNGGVGLGFKLNDYGEVSNERVEL